MLVKDGLKYSPNDYNTCFRPVSRLVLTKSYCVMVVNKGCKGWYCYCIIQSSKKIKFRLRFLRFKIIYFMNQLET